MLGLHLEPSGEQLRFYNPQRAIHLPTPAEIRDALKNELAARAAVEARVAREAAVQLAAEGEVKRLHREIEALRHTTPPGP